MTPFLTASTVGYICAFFVQLTFFRLPRSVQAGVARWHALPSCLSAGTANPPHTPWVKVMPTSLAWAATQLCNKLRQPSCHRYAKHLSIIVLASLIHQARFVGNILWDPNPVYKGTKILPPWSWPFGILILSCLSINERLKRKFWTSPLSCPRGSDRETFFRKERLKCCFRVTEWNRVNKAASGRPPPARYSLGPTACNLLSKDPLALCILLGLNYL